MRSVNKGLERHAARRAAIFLSIALGAGATGCGSVLYAGKLSVASSKLEEARKLGAEQYAAYDYYYAREHLEQAQSEAAEASYGEALDLAQASAEHAMKAIELTREAQRGAGK